MGSPPLNIRVSPEQTLPIFIGFPNYNFKMLYAAVRAGFYNFRHTSRSTITIVNCIARSILIAKINVPLDDGIQSPLLIKIEEFLTEIGGFMVLKKFEVNYRIKRFNGTGRIKAGNPAGTFCRSFIYTVLIISIFLVKTRKYKDN